MTIITTKNNNTNTNTNNIPDNDQTNTMSLNQAFVRGRKKIILALQSTSDQESSSSDSNMEIFNSNASIFAPRRHRASKVPTYSKETSLYIVEVCPNKDYLNLEDDIVSKQNDAGVDFSMTSKNTDLEFMFNFAKSR